MYIEPNSTIRLLNQVPIDSRYMDTFSWALQSDQTNYFLSKTKYTFTQQSYQRVQRGVARVQRVADDLYDVNYMMFKNTSFGNKWFYAFVNHVEYINNSVAEINFEIDVIQTWYFQTNFRQCFVQRMHADNDDIGANTVPEPVNLGEYIHNTYFNIYQFRLNIVLVSVVDLDQNGAGAYSANVCVLDNVLSGSDIYGFCLDTTQTGGTDHKTLINALLDHYKNAPDSVLSMYMCCEEFLDTTVLNQILSATDYAQCKIPSGSRGVLQGYASGSRPNPGTTALNGYIPKNNKLYTYPYHFFGIDNANGSSLVLPFEYFVDNQGQVDLIPKFRFYSTITNPIQCVLKPYGYKGVAQNALNTENLTLDGFPQCSWNVDAYKAWLAQNSIPMVLNSVGTAANLAGKGVKAYASGGMSELFGTGENGVLFDLVSKASEIGTDFYKASIAADICKGNFNNGGVNSAHGFQGFFGSRMSIKYEYARLIDQFFDCFGYQMNYHRTPNRRIRPHWTYIKTLGCIVDGAIPEDDRKKIGSLHDVGIRYWTTPSEIGNFAFDNRLV